jgi:type I restriction enzyme M protein
MNNGTKQHIDAARQVLVGKVPDPKAQVEQITNALVYKFMSDMDLQSVEAGGKASFFVEGYEQFAWQKIMDLRLSGLERMDLYVRGLESMAGNPHLPDLFRAIMKGAFLPYRDPETLNLFLKEINWFTYENSENLGDAYEYLLSVLGSQGAAGQFRTPRHIIDFMVAVMEPKKDEKILDPACGTAGFLISAYKYIAAQYQEKGLTPDEKLALANNLVGYDISPDMVKISQVNMYLHNFPDPQIYEYDTLTSEARWDDDFDCIMANPPFMSPKGGIIPHQRFAIHANRSEVLFVDYIMEHLTLHGRAAVIVPEGIIFQSANAYKNLRRMLVEDNYLYAVVSLPAGVFNPYSGVKTSILFMDRDFAKTCDSILFVEVQNDGFSQGAQRNPIEKNDLPNIIEVIREFYYGEQINALINPKSTIVNKSEIANTKDFNLSRARYIKVIKSGKAKWEFVEIGKIADVIPGQSPRGEFYNTQGMGIPFYQGKTEFTEKFLGEPKVWTTETTRIANKNDILMSVRAPVGPVNISTQEICIGRGLAAIRVNKDLALNDYIFYILKDYEKLIKGNTGSTFSSINKRDIQEIKIPLPPIEIQQEIVEELDGYQKIIAGARMVVENWKPHIEIDPTWEMVELGEVCEILDYLRKPIKKSDRILGQIPYYGATGVLDYIKGYIFDEKLVLIGEDGAKWGSGENTAYAIEGKSWVNNHAHVLRPNRTKLLDLFLITMINQMDISQFVTGVTVPKLNQKNLISIKIPLPNIKIQEEIIHEIDFTQKQINANNKLIEYFENKTKEKINKLWG